MGDDGPVFGRAALAACVGSSSEMLKLVGTNLGCLSRCRQQYRICTHATSGRSIAT